MKHVVFDCLLTPYTELYLDNIIQGSRDASINRCTSDLKIMFWLFGSAVGKPLRVYNRCKYPPLATLSGSEPAPVRVREVSRVAKSFFALWFYYCFEPRLLAECCCWIDLVLQRARHSVLQSLLTPLIFNSSAKPSARDASLPTIDAAHHLTLTILRWM